MHFTKIQKLPKLMNAKQRKTWTIDPSKCLTQTQVNKVFEIVGKQFHLKRSRLMEYVVVIFLFLTGTRKSELINLRWKHIMLDEKDPCVFIERGKSKHSRRMIPLNPFLVKTILAYINALSEYGELDSPHPESFFLKTPSGKKYSRYGLYCVFKRVMDKANISHKNPHIARHTFAVELYKRSGNDLRLVQHTLGHSSVRVTEIYTHVSLQRTKIACNQLYQEVLEL